MAFALGGAGLVIQTGRTRATRYEVLPSLLRDTGLDAATALKSIEPHRLKALIVEDVTRYPGSASPEIHKRVGSEIPPRTFRRVLKQAVDDGRIAAAGERRWQRYHPVSPIGHEGDDGQ